MRHNSVIVRTKEQLDSMNKELVNALHSIFDNGVHEPKACSIVYQFNKGADGDPSTFGNLWAFCRRY